MWVIRCLSGPCVAYLSVCGFEEEKVPMTDVILYMGTFCMILMVCLTASLSAEFTCAVAYHHVDDDGFLAVLLSEFLLHHLLEVANQFFCNQVDGATTETAAHDT